MTETEKLRLALVIAEAQYEALRTPRLRALVKKLQAQVAGKAVTA